MKISFAGRLGIIFLHSFFVSLANQSHSQSSEPVDNDPQRTIVKGSRRKQDEPQHDRRSIAAWSKASVNATETLPTLLGVTLTRQGGPLAPVDIKIRGLAGPRLTVDLSGLPLNDPGSGLVDANDLPLFALNAIQSSMGPGARHLSGQLSLFLPRVEDEFVISRFGIGSFQTGRIDWIGGTPLGEHADIFGAVQASTTAGNFVFSPSSVITSESSDALVERQNNDQNRLVGLIKISERVGQFNGSTLIFGKLHEGGIPGMAGAPTLALRGRHRYIAAMQDAQLNAAPLLFLGRLQGRLDQRTTWEKNAARISSVSYQSAKLEVEAKRSFHSTQSSLALAVSGEINDLIDRPHARQGAGLQVKAQSRFVPESRFDAHAAFALNAFSDAGTLISAFINGSFRLNEFFLTGLRVGKSARPPSFVELYAPTGVVIGNPNLRPESSYEAEVYADFRYDSFLQAKVGGFYGFIDDGIFYFNRNAFEIAPINTGGVLRGGIDARLEITPHRLVTLEWTSQFLASRLLSTGAPLPGVPMFASLVTLRVGELDGICGWLKMNYKGETSSNLFGTLTAPSYVLFDALFKLPITRSLSAHFSVSNLFNVTHARDSNQFPIPGREFFALLELST